MPDAVVAALKRKVALDAARAALRSGARSELRAALEGLPLDGTKAGKLRDGIERELSRIEANPVAPIAASRAIASCVADGIRYKYTLAETGDVAFFVASRTGSEIEVTINSVHPFGRQLARDGNWDNPTVLALLAAWAHHELDQSDRRRREDLQNARVDWGRVVRRLLTVDGRFRVG